ncbi:MAG TPA: ubiquinone/menaquinone biosynthesis methyltransferase [Bacteriovoracaceae bacterium]|nr:ubiquinone/menaquinone biosynthesis methyltransferase [Bacteriovoracaceae bacterium]
MSKAEFVRVMFNDISHKYDLLNDVLSVGTHRLWKKQFVKMIADSHPMKALDCATGTGDIAFMLNKTVPDVTGIDFSENMIDFAGQRAKKANSRVKFRVADIQRLPFEDQSFDAASISFGIRNVENLELGLKELGRVSKSLYILEFGQPKNKLFSKLYFWMLRLYVPLFGLISKRADAYEYLIASSEKFPSGEKFLEIMARNTPYKNFGYVPVFGGIAYMYFGKSEAL